VTALVEVLLPVIANREAAYLNIRKELSERFGGVAGTDRSSEMMIYGDEMPRYYFHVRKDGVLEEDLEGVEFPTLNHAHIEAIQAAREILAEKVLADDVIDGQRFEITAEDGTLLLDVPFRSALRLE
jgi:hypothetical protein